MRHRPYLILHLAFFPIIFLATACTKPKPVWPSPGVLISCLDRGSHTITGADVARAGVNPAAVDVRRMALVHYDRSVPFYAEGLDDGRLDLNDAIYFFSDGAALDDVPYVNIDKDFQPRTQRFLLRLAASEFEPRRFKPVRQRTPGEAGPAWPVATLGGRRHYEQNPIFRFVSAGPFEGQTTTATLAQAVRTDFIFWSEMSYPATDKTPSTAAMNFELAQADPASSVTLRIRLYAAAETAGGALLRHRVGISLNGKSLGEASWSNHRIHDAVLSVPAGVLADGNRLELRVLEPRPLSAKTTVDRMNLDFILLDWFELDYRQPTSTADDEIELRAGAGADAKALAQFRLEGFTSDKIRVFDLGAGELLQARPFRQGAGWAVNLARPARPTSLVAVLEDRVRTPLEVRRVVVPGRCANPADCELLVLAHPDFMNELAPLVEWKRSRGLKTDLVSIADVYNEISGGCAGPEPLHRYIEQVYNLHSPARLKYVLLVGDSISVSKYQSFCPAYAYLQSGIHASDNYFAAFDKPAGKPALAVGRLSACEPGHVANAVRKIIDYERGAHPGPWQAEVLTIAAALQWARDDARTIRERFVRPNYISLLLQTDLTNPAPDYNEQVSGQLSDLLNRGNLLTIFLGHGGGTIWEVGPAFRGADFQRHLFDQDRVSSLTNTTRLPVVCALTCYTNDFDNASVRQTLGETFVNSPGGAIAVIGTAARSSTAVNMTVLGYFMKALLERQGTRLGDFFRKAIVDTDAEIANLSYLVLGDPSLEFGLPAPDLILKLAGPEPTPSRLSLEFTAPSGVAPAAPVQFFLIDDTERIVDTWSAAAGAGRQTLTHTLKTGQLSAPLRLIAFVPDQKGLGHVGSAIILRLANGN